jgi:vacuolar iron transporter family protein
MKPIKNPVRVESWHRWSKGGGALRAIVFGANDGLVSNASLIIGVSGADPDPKVILLAGVAGLLAGGFSMAAGEYISVRTQRELLERQIALEKAELADHPEEEIGELAKIYETKGVDPEQARAIAGRILADPEKGLTTLAKEELGLDPEGLASPYLAAGSSFLSFALGAAVPLVPHLLARGSGAFLGSLAATGVSLLAVGAVMSLFTGKNVFFSALRQAFIGALAAGATYLIGRLLGVAVS